MTLPSLPTDSLHKFLGVGFLAVLVSIVYLISLQADISKKNSLKADSLQVFQAVHFIKIKKNKTKILYLKSNKEDFSGVSRFIGDKIDSLEIENVKLTQQLRYEKNFIEKYQNNTPRLLKLCAILFVIFGLVAYAFKTIFKIWVASENVIRDKMIMENINIDLQNMKLENELNFIHPLRQEFSDKNDD